MGWRSILQLTLVILVLGLVAPGLAGANVIALGWPESRQEIPNGSAVQLGEFFERADASIPCQTFVTANVVANGETTDTVSAPGSATWTECGALGVGGGFTLLQLNQGELGASAVPVITLSQAGCVYQLAQVQGRTAIQGSAIYDFNALATLLQGTPCAASLPVRGSLGLYGPQSAGFGLVPWVEFLESQNRRAREAKELAERQQKELAERQLREREHAAVVTLLRTATLPKGRSARLGVLVRSGGWAVALSAPLAGSLTIHWYSAGAAAHQRGQSRHVELARGAATFTKSATQRVRIRLTRRGRQILKRAVRVKVSATGTFTPLGEAQVATLRIFVLKR